MLLVSLYGLLSQCHLQAELPALESLLKLFMISESRSYSAWSGFRLLMSLRSASTWEFVSSPSETNRHVVMLRRRMDISLADRVSALSWADQEFYMPWPGYV